MMMMTMKKKRATTNSNENEVQKRGRADNNNNKKREKFPIQLISQHNEEVQEVGMGRWTMNSYLKSSIYEMLTVYQEMNAQH